MHVDEGRFLVALPLVVKELWISSLLSPALVQLAVIYFESGINGHGHEVKWLATKLATNIKCAFIKIVAPVFYLLYLFKFGPILTYCTCIYGYLHNIIANKSLPKCELCLEV